MLSKALIVALLLHSAAAAPYYPLGTDMSKIFSFNGSVTIDQLQSKIEYFYSDPSRPSVTSWECNNGLNSLNRYGCFLYILDQVPDPARHLDCTNPDWLICGPRKDAFWTTLSVFAPSHFWTITRGFLLLDYFGMTSSNYVKLVLWIMEFSKANFGVYKPLTDFQLLAMAAICTPITKARDPTTYMKSLTFMTMAGLNVTQVSTDKLKQYLSSSLSGMTLRYARRQTSSTVSSDTQTMLEYCNLSGINNNSTNNQNILVGCLGGIVRYCNEASVPLSECYRYYNTVYGNSMYKNIVTSCPKWISLDAPSSSGCNNAVNGVCNLKGTSSPECGFSKFSQGYLFVNRTLAPW